MIALNAVVYNEAHRMGLFLTRAQRICGEIVVVDQSSTDETAEIAHAFGATVIRDANHGICEPSLALAEEYTMSEWILRLDADEYIAPDCENWVKDVPRHAAVKYVGFSRVTTVDGVQIPDDTVQLRMYRKGTVTHPDSLHAMSRPNTGSVQANVDVISSPPGAIRHHKHGWEQTLDTQRYDDLISQGMKVGW